MKVNDWTIGLVALGASLLLHVSLFLNSGSVAGNTEAREPARKVTRVSFRSVTAPPTPAEPQPEVPEKPPEPEVTEVPEPLPKPEPPKPKRQAERARQTEPAPEPPETEPVPQQASAAEAQKSPAPAEVVAGSVADPAVIEKARQEYLRRLLGHIESNKYYPSAARRRGLEAMVKISFELLADGRIRELNVAGGHKLLRRAAEEAVEQSLPMPTPPAEVVTPLVVNFSMAYQLK